MSLPLCFLRVHLIVKFQFVWVRNTPTRVREFQVKGAYFFVRGAYHFLKGA